MGQRNQGFHEQSEFEEKIVQVNRVSKKTKGGNRIGFSVIVVVGDKKGRVGVGLGKAPEVTDAVRKASNYAKKHLIIVPLRGTTIPYEIRTKLGAAYVMLKPAPVGTGVIAGGAVRAVVEAAGIRDIVTKVLGTNNKASNVYATLEALQRIHQFAEVKKITMAPLNNVSNEQPAAEVKKEENKQPEVKVEEPKEEEKKEEKPKKTTVKKKPLKKVKKEI